MTKVELFQRLVIACAGGNASPKDIVARAAALLRIAETEFTAQWALENPNQDPRVASREFDEADEIAQAIDDLSLQMTIAMERGQDK